MQLSVVGYNMLESVQHSFYKDSSSLNVSTHVQEEQSTMAMTVAHKMRQCIFPQPCCINSVHECSGGTAHPRTSHLSHPSPSHRLTQPTFVSRAKSIRLVKCTIPCIALRYVILSLLVLMNCCFHDRKAKLVPYKGVC